MGGLGCTNTVCVGVCGGEKLGILAIIKLHSPFQFLHCKDTSGNID